MRVAGVGETGQARLRAAKVVVAGLGGLGSPAALYLAAAGVGTLGLLDPDRVALSNLQRQILYATDRIGAPKAPEAAARLAALNPHVALTVHELTLTPANAARWLADYDFIVEATDNFAAKWLVNDVCLELGKPFVTAGVVASSGQAQLVVPGQTPCLRCVLTDPPADPPTAATHGVLGPAAGVLGCIEALEAVRFVTGLWTPAPGGQGRLHSLDGAHGVRVKTVKIPRRRDCLCASAFARSTA